MKNNMKNTDFHHNKGFDWYVRFVIYIYVCMYSTIYLSTGVINNIANSVKKKKYLK